MTYRAPASNPAAPACGWSDDDGGLLGNLIRIDTDVLIDLNIGVCGEPALIDVHAGLAANVGGGCVPDVGSLLGSCGLLDLDGALC